MFAHRDALERRYDGPIPPADPAAAPVAAALRAHLFQRLAAETRAQAARRRHGLAAAAANADPRLSRLQHDLTLYRSQGIWWHGA